MKRRVISIAAFLVIFCSISVLTAISINQAQSDITKYIKTDESFDGLSWIYQVNYDCNEVGVHGGTLTLANDTTWTITVSGTEEVEWIDCYKTESTVEGQAYRRYPYPGGWGMPAMDVPVTLAPTGIGPTVHRSINHDDIIREMTPLSANAMGGINLDITRNYSYTDRPAELRVGAKWEYESVVEVNAFAFYEEMTWNAEVAAIEQITVPLGTYDCYKIVATGSGGQNPSTANYFWWSVNDEFPCPVKYVENYLYLGQETFELQSFEGYEPPDTGPVVYNRHTIDDDNSGGSSGNSNGKADAGEDIELIIELKNNGPKTTSSVSAVLSTTDSHIISITDNEENFGSIASSGTKVCVYDYDFDVSPSCPNGHVVTFTLDITDIDNNTWVDTFTVTLYNPDALQHTLNITKTGNGSTSPSVGNHVYDEGDIVGITATPASGWEFVNWTGDTATIVNPGSPNTSITMNDICAITANFTRLVIDGPSWVYNVNYDCNEIGVHGGTLTLANDTVWSMTGIGYEQIEGINCYVTESIVDGQAKRRYPYPGNMGMPPMDVPVTLAPQGVGPVVHRNMEHGEIIRETYPLLANAMGGINLDVTRNYTYDERPAELSLGATWSYETAIDLATFAFHEQMTWEAEVTAIESVTVPLGIYDCYKVVATGTGGKNPSKTNYFWWAVDEDFLCPVKSQYNYIFLGAETKELVSYTTNHKILTINKSGNGSIEPSAGSHFYGQGEVVNLVASADECWEFVDWTGDIGAIADVNDPTTTVTMNDDYSITANFIETDCALASRVLPDSVDPLQQFGVSVNCQGISIGGLSETLPIGFTYVDGSQSSNVVAVTVNGNAITFGWLTEPGTVTYEVVASGTRGSYGFSGVLKGPSIFSGTEVNIAVSGDSWLHVGWSCAIYDYNQNVIISYSEMVTALMDSLTEKITHSQMVDVLMCYLTD